MASTDPSKAGSPPVSRLGKFALAALLTVYFLIFNWPSLRVHFAIDGLANIGHYQEYSPWQLVLSNFVPWRGDSRPLGGLFYIPIYHFAGLNPMPYQAVMLAILLANVYCAYRFAVLLGAGELAAALVALACCYHGGIANLYYNDAFVFDSLCCLFYLASFVYYLRIRNHGELAGPGRTAVFLALFLCALNSKEMAVSIPVMLLTYEWFYHRPAKWSRAELLAWVRGPARMSWIAAVVTAVDLSGKLAGPNSMVATEAYRPVFTIQRGLDFQIALYQDLFCSWSWTPGWGQIVGSWALLAYLARRRADRPVLRFLFWFLLVLPLPIEFLQGRREACFVLLMVGGGIFLAVVFLDAVFACSAYVSREFRLPRLGYRLLAGVMVMAAVVAWVKEQHHLRDIVMHGQMVTTGSEEWDIIEQLRAISFHPRPGSSVAFLDDPFHTLDMYFMARLWIHDRSVNVHVVSEGPLTPQEIAKTDYVFTIENRKVIRVK